jgi:glycine/D-amino acid oxidase-like deaminating enzyme
VLVIGAGITGAMIAEALSAAGHEIIIVDKRGLAKGSTAFLAMRRPLLQVAHFDGASPGDQAPQRPRLREALL